LLSDDADRAVQDHQESSNDRNNDDQCA
jgi:hypothetical protein